MTVRHAFLPPFRAEVLFTDAVIDVAFISYNTATTTLEPLEMRVVTADNLGETLLVLGYSGGWRAGGRVGWRGSDQARRALPDRELRRAGRAPVAD